MFQNLGKKKSKEEYKKSQQAIGSLSDMYWWFTTGFIFKCINVRFCSGIFDRN